MDLNILDQHQIIGIDFDGTLVNHPRSAILQQYIVDHPEKTFHLISFRTHNMKKQLERDLWLSRCDTGVPIFLKHFAGIHCIPDMFYERKGLLDDGREYWGWKALQCVEHGCTLMVDDMHDVIGVYCLESKVHCLNPDLWEGYVKPNGAEDLAEWLKTDRGQYGECDGTNADELFRQGRIVWYEYQTDFNGAHFSWPPPSKYCWIDLIRNANFAALRIKAIEVLGSEHEATEWMHRPAMALNQQRPIDLMIDPDTAQDVEDLLGRIEHGVYT